MIVRDAGEDDLPGILEIYNEAVLHTTAIWNETVVNLENRRSWMGERRRAGYPVLAAADQTTVLGFASFGDFRAWDGYRYTVEHSVYVRDACRGRGIGQALLCALIGRAASLGKRVMIAGIEGGNLPSIRLHQRLGFRVAGRLEQVGVKFGRELDLVLMQRMTGTD